MLRLLALALSRPKETAVRLSLTAVSTSAAPQAADVLTFIHLLGCGGVSPLSEFR